MLKRYIIFPILIILISSTFFTAYGWEMVLEGNLEEMFDDNVKSSKSDKISDFVTNIKAGIGLQDESKNNFLKFIGGIKQAVYAKHGKYNNNSQNFNLLDRIEISNNDHIQIKNDFIHADEPVDFESEFYRGSSRYDYFKNRIECTYLREITSNLSINALFANEYYKNNKEGVSDSYLNNGGIYSVYTWDRQNTTSIYYNYYQRNYYSEGNAAVHSGAIDHRYFFTQLLYFDNRLGLIYIKRDNPESTNNKTYIKPNITSSLIYELNQNSRFNFTYTKQYSLNSTSNDVNSSWSFSGEFIRQLSVNFRLALATFYGNSKYVTTGYESKFVGANISAYYAITEQTEISLKYTFRANLNENDEYTRNNITIGISSKL